MIVAEFSITPVTGEDMRPYVDAAVEEVKKAGLKYEVDAMSTTIEGEVDQVFEVVKRAHNAAKSKGAGRLMTQLRIDDKRTGVTIEQEVQGYRASV